MLLRIVFCSIIKVSRKSYETEITSCDELPIIIKNTGANENADKNTNVNAGTNVDTSIGNTHKHGCKQMQT